MAGKEIEMTYRKIKKIPFLYGPLHGKVKEFVDGDIVPRTVIGESMTRSLTTGSCQFVYVLREYVSREYVLSGESHWIYELETEIREE